MNSDAYDAGLPCQNPNCRSQGKPHANCECYGSMAEGGDVSFCSKSKKHNENCQYFAEGSTDIGTDDQPPPPPGFELDQAAPSIDSGSVPPPPPGFELDQSDGTSAETPPPPGYELDKDYTTTGQHIGADIEGVAKGLTGPVAPFVEQGLSAIGVPGLSRKDQAGRAAAFPNEQKAIELGTAVASTLIPGVKGISIAGNIMKAAKEANIVRQAAQYTKFGAGAIRNLLAGTAFVAADGTTKALLGQPGGDPESIISSAIAAAPLNMITGGVFEMLPSGLKAAGADKLAQKGSDYLRGVGVAAQHAGDVEALERLANAPATSPAYQAGMKWVSSYLPKTLRAVPATVGGGVGGSAGGLLGSLIGHEATGAVQGTAAGAWLGNKFSEQVAQKLGMPINGIVKKTVPLIALKVLGGGATDTLGADLATASEYGSAVARGQRKLNDAVMSLFNSGVATKFTDPTDRERNQLLDFITKGGVDPEIKAEGQTSSAPSQQFAEGGKVTGNSDDSKPIPLSDKAKFLTNHYPDQAPVYGAMRGRVSNYLKSLKPQENQPKLAFDTVLDQKDQHRVYNKAIDVALNPLSVMGHIKKGTIDADHLKHLNNLYPELTNQLRQKVTEQISQAQLKGAKPSYKIRKGLSMLMGTPLDSTMTPSSIQAAQHVFQAKKAAQQQAAQDGGGKVKKGTASLGKIGPNNMTPDQARQARENKS